MFVNHPQDVERGAFIRKAFRDFKWIDAGMGELIKVSLRAEDIATSGIKECCFKNCLLYTSPSPRDVEESRMPSSA